MRKQSIAGTETSSIKWETVEAWGRAHVQGFIQQVLEEEVMAFLDRKKSARRAQVDAPPGYRNGHGKPRRLTLSCGTITVQRPRIRQAETRFESQVLPLFKRKRRAVEMVLPELSLRGLLGEDAPLSGPTVARVKEKGHAELAVWQTRRLEDVEAVYGWVEGSYVKAGLEKDKAALLVVLAALSNGRKVRVGCHTRSSGIHRQLGGRTPCSSYTRPRPPRLVVGDGHLGIWAALRGIYPEAEEPRCWNHKILNVLDKLPKRQQGAAKALVHAARRLGGREVLGG